MLPELLSAHWRVVLSIEKMQKETKADQRGLLFRLIRRAVSGED